MTVGGRKHPTLSNPREDFPLATDGPVIGFSAARKQQSYPYPFYKKYGTY
jgi:hypothetical protein